MKRLSPAMEAKLESFREHDYQWASGAYPGCKVRLHDPTLEALWRRGLVTFDVRARLTSEGQEALVRLTPGKRNFRIVE